MIDTFQERYNEFKQELLDLKTAHDMRSNMRTFFMDVYFPETYNFQATTFRVTHADGDQPILTTVVGQHSIIPLEPVGNVQDFVYAEKYGTYLFGDYLSFMSTRQILSIQIIHP